MTDQAIAKSDLRSVTQNRIGKILNTAGIYGIALLFLILGSHTDYLAVTNADCLRPVLQFLLHVEKRPGRRCIHRHLSITHLNRDILQV